MQGRVYVTGANGALGSAIAAHLAARGAEVVAVARRPAPAGLPDGLRWHVDPDIWQARWFEGGAGAAVVHCAGLSEHGAAPGGRDRLVAAHVTPHLEMAGRLAARGFAGRFVLPSSAAVYGPGAGAPMDEAQPLQPVGPYGLQKVLLEEGLERAAIEGGFTVAALRIANAYGAPGDRRRVVALLVEALRSGAPFAVAGGGRQSRDYLHADDLCDAVAAAATCSLPAGPFIALNVGSGRATSLNELIALMEQISGRRLNRVESDGSGGAPFSVLDVSRAARVLGWSPRVTLNEGLARVLRAAGLVAPDQP